MQLKSFCSLLIITVLVYTTVISAGTSSKELDFVQEQTLTQQAYNELMKDPDFRKLNESLQVPSKKGRSSKIPLDQRFVFYFAGTVLEAAGSQELKQDEDFLAAFSLNMKEEADRHGDALDMVKSSIGNQYLGNLCGKMADDLYVSGSWSGNTVSYWDDKAELIQNKALVTAKKCQIIFRLTGQLEAHGEETLTYGPLHLGEGDTIKSGSSYLSIKYISQVLKEADNFSFTGDHRFWKEVYSQFLLEAERISDVLNDIAPYFEDFEAGIECSVSGEEMKGYIIDQRPDESSTSSNYWMNLAEDASEYLEDTGERLDSI